MYTTILASYSALIYRAAGKRKDEPTPIDPEVAALSDELEARFPRLRNFRNLLQHPPIAMMLDDEQSWHLFSDGPMVMLNDGGAAYIVDVEMDHDFVMQLHRRFLRIVNRAIDAASS